MWKGAKENMGRNYGKSGMVHAGSPDVVSYPVYAGMSKKPKSI